MFKLNLKKLFLVIIIIFALGLLYVISPITRIGEPVVDYSERYYELLNKGILSEEEHNEFELEKEKFEKKLDEYIKNN